MNKTFLVWNNKPNQTPPPSINDLNTTFEDVGKVVIWDGNKILLTSPENFDKYDVDKHTPIGIIVIPSSHDIYGTGEGAMMSIKEMSYNTPNEGTDISSAMCFGQYSTDIQELQNYTGTSAISNTNWDLISVISQGAYLPSDQKNWGDDLKNPNINSDQNVVYYYDDDDPHVPSPYTADGTFNSDYAYQNNGNVLNALSDFDGINNTQILLNNATTQSDWKTDPTIRNNSAKGYSPAACCCWRYYTLGTNQGEWYLPAMGELGYIMVRKEAINNTINAIKDKWGIGIPISPDSHYWSSTEQSSSNMRTLDAYNGGVLSYYKNTNGHVYAFHRI